MVCAMPNGVRWVVRTWPLPPQSGQTSGVVPGAQPVPLQSVHGIPCLAAAAEAENVAETGEDIAEISETAAKSAETAAEACVGVKGCMTVLIVLLPLFLVGEDFIGLVGLLEAFFAGLVAGMQVRVVFLGDLAVCFFYFF